MFLYTELRSCLQNRCRAAINTNTPASCQAGRLDKREITRVSPRGADRENTAAGEKNAAAHARCRIGIARDQKLWRMPNA